MVIDAVITWVDGSDKKWQEKLNKYAKVKIDFNKKKESVRYNSIGEIDIAIKSIIKFAPFIRTIFLVTDSQKPESFNSLKSLAESKNINLELIDHTVIFKDFEDHLFVSCHLSVCMLTKQSKTGCHACVHDDPVFVVKYCVLASCSFDHLSVPAFLECIGAN